MVCSSTQWQRHRHFESRCVLHNLHCCALQVSKDVDSGITHYVCIHVASEVTTKAARELDPTSPVALPKLPNGMAETPTARSPPSDILNSPSAGCDASVLGVLLCWS